MPRRKMDARRLPFIPADMPLEFWGGVPLEIPVLTSNCYDDAQSRGWLRIPIPVEVSTSFDEAFQPLSKEDEKMVRLAFSRDKGDILVEHRKSNIVITGDTLGCLRPRQWLNDDVVNLYMILLKEREIRQPNKHLKCHFFNTFFFQKLVKSRNGYNYDSVRNWTSMKKLGYHINDCDKIFVPISSNLHWTLVVINVKDQKFEYLDSFKGYDSVEFINALARYYVDEVKDKTQEEIDVSRWTQEFVHDLPVQINGFDCGMFMLKYMDFYSRGLDLCFSEDQMTYFRFRTAKEILQLKVD